MEDTPRAWRHKTARGIRRDRPRKRLFNTKEESQHPRSTRELPNWTDAELRCLTLFLVLHTDGKTWVAHKNFRFWDQAGVFIQQLLHTAYCRSGKKETQTPRLAMYNLQTTSPTQVKHADSRLPLRLLGNSFPQLQLRNTMLANIWMMCNSHNL